MSLSYQKMYEKAIHKMRPMPYGPCQTWGQSPKNPILFIDKIYKQALGRYLKRQDAGRDLAPSCVLRAAVTVWKKKRDLKGYVR